MVVALPFSLSATIIQHLPAYIYSFPYYFDQIKFNSQYVKWNDLEGHLVESKQCARLPPSFHARNRAENFVMCDLFRIYFSDFCVFWFPLTFFGTIIKHHIMNLLERPKSSANLYILFPTISI